MAATGKLIFIAAVASICLCRGWSKEGRLYIEYGRDVQSPRTYSDPDHNVTAQVKQAFRVSRGFNNQPHHNHGIPPTHPSGNNVQTLYEFCTKYQEYNTLLQLKDNISCLRATDVWSRLESLNQHPNEGPLCRVQIIHLLSAAFWNIDKTPDYCHCQGNVQVSDFPNRDYHTFLNCWNIGDAENNYYQKIYSEYYNNEDNLGRQSTHQHIWNLLSQITDVACQENLIMNLAYTFNNYAPTFGCSEVSSVHHPTHQADSTTPTNTPTHNPETTNTPSYTPEAAITPAHTPEAAITPAHTPEGAITPAHTPEATITPAHTPEGPTMDTPQTTQTRAIQTCNKYSTISNLAHGTVFSHPSASNCGQDDHTGSEALVFQLCHTNEIHSWIKGASVIDNCSQIPLYTPVATFIQDSFIPNGGQAGIFLGCLPNGFKMAAQTCFANSTVMHIEKGGSFTRDPSVYHVVLF